MHPTTFLLVGAAGAAFWLVYRTREQPMWHPQRTERTVSDEPEPAYEGQDLLRLVTGVVALGLVTAGSGAVVAESAENVVPSPASRRWWWAGCSWHWRRRSRNW